MAKKKRKDIRFINGVPELLILSLLSRREMYGYQIVKAIQETTHDAFSFGEGCIYLLLRGLQKKGRIRSRRLAMREKARDELDVHGRRPVWRGMRVREAAALIGELRDHREDLHREAVESGMDRVEA